MSSVSCARQCRLTQHSTSVVPTRRRTTRARHGRTQSRGMMHSMIRARAHATAAPRRRNTEVRALARGDGDVARRWLASTAASLVVLASPFGAHARLEGVNNPNLLPPGPPVPVLDVAGYLTPGDVKRLTNEVTSLERDTGVKLRVLAQAYPQTPGLAVKDYWNVDDDTVVFVADPGLGNILNFSVGGNLDLDVPPSFWTRLANKYGTKFYWSDKGEEASISAAVNAIDQCLREEPGRAKCSKIAEYVDFDAVSASASDANVSPGGGLFGLFGN